MKVQPHFRIQTIEFLHEIADCGLDKKMGILKVPLNVLMNHLGQIATRCTEIHDPVLDRIMFDMALYELPNPTTPEYGKLMKQLYARERKYLKT